MWDGEPGRVSAGRISRLLSFRGRDQLQEVLLRIAIVFLPSLAQAALGELQGPGGLLSGQHGLGGGAAESHLARHPIDQPLEYSFSIVDFAALYLDLPTTQLIVIAAAAFVVLAV